MTQGTFYTLCEERNNIMTVGTHLIWTTYGTWLPGDDRGHWSPLFDMYGHLLERGHKLNLPDPVTRQRTMAAMKEAPKFLSLQETEVVADVIGKIIGDMPVGRFVPQGKGAICRAYALAIEPTHVHLLIGPLAENLHKTVGRLKGVSSSLILGLPHNVTRQRTWTADFWRVFLYDSEGLHAVYHYIIEHNLRTGRPAHPWAFIRPPLSS
jgi:hypothetical protein